jgi:hypothetical protein
MSMTAKEVARAINYRWCRNTHAFNLEFMEMVIAKELEQRERELREALSAAIECIEEHVVDTERTYFSWGKEYGSVASFVGEWRAALNPTEGK